MELVGRVAIVTGAGRYRGIGRATALALARAGSSVAITGTGRPDSTYPDDERAIGWRDIESVADEIRAMGREALPIVANLANPEEAKAIVERTVERFGRVDILVNNAAYGRGADRRPVVELDDAMWHQVLAVKLDGTYYASKAAAKQMIKQGEGGSIVTVSSIAGKIYGANAAAYVVANAGVQALAGSMSKELGKFDINVNCVCPGVIDTSRMDDLGRGERWDTLLQNVPLGRAGKPEEVAAFITYLCSPSGRWISGQSINVDGGQVSH